MAITDNIYIKNHRQFVSPLEMSFPKSAFAGAFPFETFNAMQAETLSALIETKENVVVSAPTA
ncbi:hypothetical protein [Halorhabdus sp. BNX81]|uniref:hypothetical protein n=1 Tax=Halorhabdus sp. BNX81 TaxID=2980181 RepID=UPI0023DD0164|nr:hypothetical protein [Halorhabdus sp. BNX81]